MPIPLIAAGILAATALTGIGSGVKAAKNSNEAKRVNSRASSIMEEAEEQLNNRRQSANNSLESLGEIKITILSTTVKEFVQYFQLLKNVTFQDKTAGIEELKYIGHSTDLIGELETASITAVKIASGGLASLGTGVLTAYGAYAGTMALGTASTGALISGLTGVAATNATLAWLGGGALSVGGLGMAGGTLVLGGLVAGPALAVGGIIMSAQSKKKLNAAYDSLSEAQVIVEQMKSAGMGLNRIQLRARKLKDLLLKTDGYFKEEIIKLQHVISNSGTNWNDLTREEKETIHKGFLLAQLVKGIIDTSLLDEDGTITKKSNEILKNSEIALREIQSI